jgi:hypothetical protein
MTCAESHADLDRRAISLLQPTSTLSAGESLNGLLAIEPPEACSRHHLLRLCKAPPNRPDRSRRYLFTRTLRL